jgi:methionyl-tRNA formyltransferase
MIMKIGYFADGPWSHEAIKKFETDNEIDISFVCVRHDNPDPFLVEYSKTNFIPCYDSPNVNSTEFIKEASKYNADIFVSMSFNQIFRSELINIPKLKTINCHAGKLPCYRGRNVLNWALINGEKEFGITVHYVDEGIDTGDIILQASYDIDDSDDYGTILQRAYIGCAELLHSALRQIIEGTAGRISQDTIDPVGFYCGQRKPGDEIIDWRQSSRDLFNFIRAVAAPGPMARGFINGKEIKINRARIISGTKDYIGICGQVIGKSEDDLLVKTKDNFLAITEYYFDGKIKIGDRISNTCQITRL